MAPFTLKFRHIITTHAFALEYLGFNTSFNVVDVKRYRHLWIVLFQGVER